MLVKVCLIGLQGKINEFLVKLFACRNFIVKQELRARGGFFLGFHGNGGN